MTRDAPFLTLYLANADETARLGAWLAPRLQVGDCLLLTGPIGAGKSHLARTIIQTRLGQAEDVPSPTFTLVQSYQADVEIWHADLYRLSHPDEVLELGLETAFETAITLIEWPDRLGRFTPTGAIHLKFSLSADGRQVDIWPGARLDLCHALAVAFGAHD
jgi:tRNA threonylcarbamoyladenosine biosynthesis protein TsaE